MAEAKKTGAVIYTLVISVVVASAFFWPFVCMCRDASRLGSAAGTAEGAMTVTDMNGVHLLLFDEVRRGDAHGHRVTSIDTATGRETGRHLRRGYGRIECKTSGLSRLWCSWHKGDPEPWSLVDVRTLDETTDILRAVKASGVGRVAPRPITLRGDAAYVILDDGRIASWDARTQAVTVVQLIPSERDTAGSHSDCSTRSTYEQGGARMQLLGDPRTRLVIGDEVAEQAGGPPGAEFLKPGFVDLDVRGGALVLHESSLDPKRSIPQLSSVDWKGQIVWTQPIGGACETISLANDEIVVTTKARKPRAIAFDARTGAMRWRIDR